MEQRGEHEGLFTPDSFKIQPGQSPYTDLSVQRPGWTRLLSLTCIVTTFGSTLPVGYNIGVVNTPAEIIRTFANASVYRYDTVLTKGQLDLLWSFTVSIFLVGATVGSLGGSILADKAGRKRVLLVSSVLAFLAAVLFFGSKAANSLEMVILGRLLVGLSSGLSTSVVPMYLCELAPLHLKGATGVLFQLGVTIGVLLGQIMSLHDILGNETYWPHCLAAYVVPVLIYTAIFPVLPESPKYMYVIKRQPQVALELLTKLRNGNQNIIQEEIGELKLEEQNNQRNRGEPWTLGRVLSDSRLVLPLSLVCCLQAGQQLSGINAVFYYSTDIFKSAGLSLAAREYATIGAGCCNLFVAVLSMYSMSKIARRTCLQVSLLTSIFFLVSLGISIMFMKSYSWVPYISIIGVLGYVICYGIGLGPIPYFIGSELFEVGPRSTAMSLGGMSNWGANFVIGLTFPSMQNCIGPASFFVFAGFTTALFFFIRFYFPETKDRDPSEIAKICQKGFASRPLAENAYRDYRENQNLFI